MARKGEQQRHEEKLQQLEERSGKDWKAGGN
jgi:hypothetical protein